jgi:hypothetical protein
MLGGGLTVIVKIAVDENPGVFVAVHVTVVVPTLKKLPEGKSHVGPEITPSGSVAVTCE